MPITDQAGQRMLGLPSATANSEPVTLGQITDGSLALTVSSLSLTTPLSVAQGGTGSATAAGARTNLAAAASGANSDITSMSGFTGLLDLSNGAAGQIKFPATQNASTDAHTLDDYEEGTFTPSVIGDTVNGSGTYTDQSGIYQKIGKFVNFQLRLSWTAHTGTGNMLIIGLPFTSTKETAVSVYMQGVPFTNSTIQAGLVSGTTNLELVQIPTSGYRSRIPINSSGTLTFNGTYATSA